MTLKFKVSPLSKGSLFTPNFTYDQNPSIGFKKGVYGGRYRHLHPPSSTHFLMVAGLLIGALFMTILILFQIIFIKNVQNILQIAQGMIDLIQIFTVVVTAAPSVFLFLLTAIIVGFLNEMLIISCAEIAPGAIIEVPQEVGTMDLAGSPFLD